MNPNTSPPKAGVNTNTCGFIWTR